jgi:hypothetical protein
MGSGSINFDELSEEELNNYCDSHFSGMEEYEDKKFVNKLSSEIKSVNNDLKLASSLCSRVTKDLRNYDTISSAVTVKKILVNIKTAWEKCSDFMQHADLEAKNKGYIYPESNSLMDSKEIIVTRIPEGYNITFPRLIPHRKLAPFIPDYIESYRMPIYNALKREFPNKRPLFVDVKCDVLIFHHFATENDLIDYDNFDYTHLLNCLASFFLTDDNPKYYRLIVDCAIDGRNFTEVTLRGQQ